VKAQLPGATIDVDEGIELNLIPPFVNIKPDGGVPLFHVLK
jgi:hypothetical protein